MRYRLNLGKTSPSPAWLKTRSGYVLFNGAAFDESFEIKRSVLDLSTNPNK